MTPTADGVESSLRRLGFRPTAAPRLTAHGWESHVFDCVTETGRLAVRVHAGIDPTRAQREADIMQAVGTLSYPVPRVHALTTVDERPALVLDFVDGPTLADCGWPIERVAETCVALMRRLHALPVRQVEDPLAWFAQGTADLAVRLPRFAPYVTALWRAAPGEVGAAYCHLDFHPANVLWDGDPWVIDWTSGRITDPRFDFAWTRLLAAMYEPEWLDWLPEDTEDRWFSSAMALRRLATVASMLESGDHAAGNALEAQLDVMRVPAAWLEEGTRVAVPDVEALLFG